MVTPALVCREWYPFAVAELNKAISSIDLQSLFHVAKYRKLAADEPFDPLWFDQVSARVYRHHDRMLMRPHRDRIGGKRRSLFRQHAIALTSYDRL